MQVREVRSLLDAFGSLYIRQALHTERRQDGDGSQQNSHPEGTHDCLHGCPNLCAGPRRARCQRHICVHPPCTALLRTAADRTNIRPERTQLCRAAVLRLRRAAHQQDSISCSHSLSDALYMVLNAAVLTGAQRRDSYARSGPGTSGSHGYSLSSCRGYSGSADTLSA